VDSTENHAGAGLALFVCVSAAGLMAAPVEGGQTALGARYLEAPVLGIERRTLRYGPTLQYPIHLQAKVIMQPAGLVALHHEDRCL
jgi:hypothetical protein